MSELPPSPHRFALTGPPELPSFNGAGHVPEPDSDGPSLLEHLGALRRHLWLVLLVSALGVGLAGYAVYKTEPLYGSKAVLQLLDERGAPTGGLAGLAASLGGGGGSFASQVQVVRSRVVLGEVVDSLGLRLQRRVPGVVRSTFQPTGVVDQVKVAPDASVGTLHLEFTEGGVSARSESSRATAKYGEPVEIGGVRFTVPERPERDDLTLYVIPRAKAVDGLLENVRVFPRDGTNVVDVIATGYDPVITERLANTTAERYRKFSSRRSRDQAQRRRQFVAEQLAVAESLLTSTQDQLTEFRRREMLYSSKAAAMMEQGGRSELEVLHAQLQADRQMYQQFLAELQRPGTRSTTSGVLRSIVSTPGTATNPVIMGLYDQLHRYQEQRDSLVSGPYGSSATNPDVQRVDTLVARTEARLVAATRSHIEALDARATAVGAIRSRADSTLRHIATAEPEEMRLVLRMESISEAAKALRERYYTAGMVEAAELDQVTLLDEALPGELAGSGPYRSLILGLVFGLMVGGAGAIALDSTNRTIRRREDLEQILRVPGLAVIPQFLPAAGRRAPLRLPSRSRNGNGVPGEARGKDLVAATRVHSVGAEAYRTLRTNLVFSPGVGTLRSVVVTSPSGAEGKTTTAANLAITFAQKGMRVLLVDADLRRPRLHSLFGVPREPGLSELLLGEVAAEQVIRRTSTERLSVLPAGSLPLVSPTDLLDGGVVRSLIDALAEDFDLVIIDTPPVLVTANAAVLGTQVDGVVLVVRAGQTDRDAARQAVQQLATVGARVVGAVLNDPDATIARRKGEYDEEPALAGA